MVVPEMPNEQPEVANKQAAETTRNLQDAVQGGPQVNLNDLDSVFSDQGNANANLPDLAFSEGDKAGTAVNDQIASMTTQELDAATKSQLAYVDGLKGQIAQVTNIAQAADIKQRADKLAEADAYFASTT